MGYEQNYIFKQGIFVALSSKMCKSHFQNSQLNIKGDYQNRTIQRKCTKPKAEIEKKEPDPNKIKTQRKPSKHWRYRIRAALRLRRFSKPVLLTISYPQGTTDQECHRLLNIWFTRMRKFKQHLLYIWVAERQKNGTLHFHVILSEAYPLAHLKQIMRESLKGIYTNWQNYNGMDIRNIKGKEKMAKYLVKYLNKSPEGANCSKALRFINLGAVLEEVPDNIDYNLIIAERWFSIYAHKETKDKYFGYMFELNNRLVDDMLLERFVPFKINNIMYEYI